MVITVKKGFPVAALTMLLTACGGSDPSAATETASTVELQRPQDTRTFTVNEASLPFTALTGAAPADRWWGTLEGSGYRIEVPQSWNGKLVMYAHGYAGTGTNLSVSNPAIRRHLIDQGYAWAASSYSKNYYDVRAGVEDTNALALAFTSIAAKNGRTLSAPTKTYIIGVSMGGHITAAAVDEEAIQYANHKVRYDGAVPMCGVLGDTELYDFFAAYQAAAMQLAGLPAASWPVTNWTDLEPTVKNALFQTFPSGATAGVMTAQGEKLKQIVENLTGGDRPMFDIGFSGPYTSTVWTTFGRDGKMLGILNEDVVSTKDFVYQIDTLPALTAEETAFNNAIYRVLATPDANRLRYDGLRWVPKTNARISVPVVSIHTLGDMYVPFSMEQIFKKRADALGTSKWLVQRAIRGVAHCDFSINEQVKAFSDMTAWESGGSKPEGDDVMTPSVVADPKYGCKFTDNTMTVDDSSTLSTTRTQLSTAYPCS